MLRTIPLVSGGQTGWDARQTSTAVRSRVALLAPGDLPEPIFGWGRAAAHAEQSTGRQLAGMASVVRACAGNSVGGTGGDAALAESPAGSTTETGRHRLCRCSDGAFAGRLRRPILQRWREPARGSRTSSHPPPCNRRGAATATIGREHEASHGESHGGRGFESVIGLGRPLTVGGRRAKRRARRTMRFGERAQGREAFAGSKRMGPRGPRRRGRLVTLALWSSWLDAGARHRVEEGTTVRSERWFRGSSPPGVRLGSMAARASHGGHPAARRVW